MGGALTQQAQQGLWNGHDGAVTLGAGAACARPARLRGARARGWRIRRIAAGVLPCTRVCACLLLVGQSAPGAADLRRILVCCNAQVRDSVNNRVHQRQQALLPRCWRHGLRPQGAARGHRHRLMLLMGSAAWRVQLDHTN